MPARKSEHQVRTCARHHNESVVEESTPDQPTRLWEPFGACEVEMQLDEFEVNELPREVK